MLAVQMRHARADKIDDVPWCADHHALICRSKCDTPTEFECCFQFDRLDWTDAGNALEIRQGCSHQAGYTTMLVDSAHGDGKRALALRTRGTSAPDDGDQFCEAEGFRSVARKAFTWAFGRRHVLDGGICVQRWQHTRCSRRVGKVVKGASLIRCQARCHQITYGTAP